MIGNKPAPKSAKTKIVENQPTKHHTKKQVY